MAIPKIPSKVTHGYEIKGVGSGDLQRHLRRSDKYIVQVDFTTLQNITTPRMNIISTNIWYPKIFFVRLLFNYSGNHIGYRKGLNHHFFPQEHNFSL